MNDSERIARIETIVSELQKRLLGDGRPGEIEFIHERINGHGKRITKLENWRVWVVGVAVGLGVSGGVGLTKLLEKLFP